MNEERAQDAGYLENMMRSPGGILLFKHIEEEITRGWDEFIKLPVAQKTSKAAFNYQAKYEVLKGIKEWVEDEIRLCKDLR